MRLSAAVIVAVALAVAAADAQEAIAAKVPQGTAAPAWDRGIQPIGRDSYYNAIDCGKRGGARSLCVFPDADLCKNDDFVLALFTPYKQVAYEVWLAVSKKQEPPTPSYADAQRTRVTIGVTPAKGSKNAITGVTITRGGKAIKPATQSLETGGGGKFIFDPAVFAPTEHITLELAGRARTLKCEIGEDVLKFLR